MALSNPTLPEFAEPAANSADGVRGCATPVARNVIKFDPAVLPDEALLTTREVAAWSAFAVVNPGGSNDQCIILLRRVLVISLRGRTTYRVEFYPVRIRETRVK
jgi:hypothetical protein